MNYSKIVPITDLRRKFGEITADIADGEGLLLTKGGEPFATLKATPNVKLRNLSRAFGAWKNTEMDRDDLWKEVLTRKSRAKPVEL